jgi:hypothetical protein
VDEPDLYDVFVHPLHAAGVHYMIVGSVASMHFGEPRFTMDVDLVVQLNDAEVAKIAQIFSAEDYYVPPPEVIAQEMRRAQHGHFNVIHLNTGLKADFYPPRRGADWSWVWERRRCDDIEGHETWFAPPEYVILAKLEFHREGGSEKHLRDIRGMLAVSGDQIHHRLIEDTAVKLGLAQQWRAAIGG